MAPKKDTKAETSEKKEKKPKKAKDEEEEEESEDDDGEDDDDDDEEETTDEVKKEEKKKKTNADTIKSGLRFDVNLIRKALIKHQRKLGYAKLDDKGKPMKDSKGEIKARFSFSSKGHIFIAACMETLILKMFELVDKFISTADLKIVTRIRIKKALQTDKHWKSFFKYLIDEFKEAGDYSSICGIEEKDIEAYLNKTFPSLSLRPTEGTEQDKTAQKSKTMNFVNYLLNYVFSSISRASCEIADYSGKSRISPREIYFATKLLFTGGIFEALYDAMKKISKAFDLNDPSKKQTKQSGDGKKKKSKKAKKGDKEKPEKKKKKEKADTEDDDE